MIGLGRGRTHLHQAAESYRANGAGNRFAAGAGKKGWRVRPVLDPGPEPLEVAPGGCSCSQ